MISLGRNERNEEKEEESSSMHVFINHIPNSGHGTAWRKPLLFKELHFYYLNSVLQDKSKNSIQ